MRGYRPSAYGLAEFCEDALVSIREGRVRMYSTRVQLGLSVFPDDDPFDPPAECDFADSLDLMHGQLHGGADEALDV